MILSYELKVKREKERHGLVSYICFSIPMFAFIRTYANSFNDVCNIIWPRLTLQQIKRISCGRQCHKNHYSNLKNSKYSKNICKKARILISQKIAHNIVYFFNNGLLQKKYINANIIYNLFLPELNELT